MPIPENIKDPKLYRFAESEAKERTFSSEQYRRKWIEKRYRSLGGKVKEEKKKDEIPKNIENPELYKYALKESEELYDAGGPVEESYLSKEEWVNKRYRELGGKKTKDDETIDRRTERIDQKIDTATQYEEKPKKEKGVPKNVKNPSLYLKAKKEADEKFDEKTSAYKSMWIVKRYKELGGKYSTAKKDTGETTRWLEEKWVQIIPFVTKNEEIECGSAVRQKKACRPLKRVDKNTPMTIKEIVKKHGKEKVIELAKEKNKDMKGRLNWQKGEFKESK